MEGSRSETVENQGSNHERNPNGDRAQLLEDALLRMTNCVELLVGERMGMRGLGNNENIDGVIFERFQKCRPSKFNGEDGADGAEKWMAGMENIFRAMNYTEEKKVTLASYQLEGRAMDWWDFLRQKWERNGTPRTWANFWVEFEDKFLPKVERERREDEFRNLKQGTLTVEQYEVKFSKLSKYAPKLVDTEESRKRCFWLGLDLDIQRTLVSTKYDTYADLVEYAQRAETVLGKVKMRKVVKETWIGSKKTLAQGQSSRPPQKKPSGPPSKRTSESSISVPAKRVDLPPRCSYCGKGRHELKDCWKKTGKCLGCGSKEHRVRECPLVAGESAKPLAIAPAQPGKSRNTAKSKVPARVCAVNKEDVDKDTSVRKGMFLASGKLAKSCWILVRPISFRPKFIQELGLKLENCHIGQK